MFKYIKISFFAAAVALTFAACSEDKTQQVNNVPQPVCQEGQTCDLNNLACPFGYALEGNACVPGTSVQGGQHRYHGILNLNADVSEKILNFFYGPYFCASINNACPSKTQGAVDFIIFGQGGNTPAQVVLNIGGNGINLNGPATYFLINQSQGGELRFYPYGLAFKIVSEDNRLDIVTDTSPPTVPIKIYFQGDLLSEGNVNRIF